MKRTLELTGDGSHTVRCEDSGECFHSKYGAIQESMHIFVDQGLRALTDKTKVNLLEVGMGSGLNVLLTCCTFLNIGKEVFYYAIEPCPLEPELFNALNYKGLIGECNAGSILGKIHHGSPGKAFELSPGFLLYKDVKPLQKVELPDAFYDLVYYDAFSPDAQPEMWEPEVLAKVFPALRPKGVLLTYTVKGSVKRTLRSIGFDVELHPGPPGKRHMLRAVRRD